jgi:AraC-like DNA-binding protein
MARLETITMSMRDLDSLKTIQASREGHLTASLAAARLKLTRRQVNRLLQRFLSDSPCGLVSRKRGKPSNYQLPDGLAE